MFFKENERPPMTLQKEIQFSVSDCDPIIFISYPCLTILKEFPIKNEDAQEFLEQMKIHNTDLLTDGLNFFTVQFTNEDVLQYCLVAVVPSWTKTKTRKILGRMALLKKSA